MWRHRLCGVLIVCVGVFSNAGYAQDNSGKQMIVSVKISEKASESSKATVLAEPAIVTVAGRPFSFESGGNVKRKNGDAHFEIGMRVTGKVDRTENGTVQLALKIRTSSEVSQENNPETDVVRTETLDIRTTFDTRKKLLQQGCATGL